MTLLFLIVLSLCIAASHEVDAARLPGSREVKAYLLKRENEFECVDIYKQPSLDHPLLKNHKIQLKPTFARDRMQSGRSPKIIDNINKGCPPGKVPIHKKQQTRLGNFSQYSQIYPNHHFATLDTNTNTKLYRGAIASLNVNNISIEANQYSLAQVWLQGAPTKVLPNLQSIQAGWGVHPSLYGDSLIRLTGYYTEDNFEHGCFNIECPGFVQINQVYTFGYLIALPANFTPGDTSSFDIQIMQDDSYGHWWLTVGHGIELGYWPHELAMNLANGASIIRFGGATYSPPNMNSPPMGTGNLPKTKFPNACYFARLRFVDSDLKINEVIRDDMKTYVDTSTDCYDIWYVGFQGGHYRQTFLFGGPGGQCGI